MQKQNLFYPLPDSSTNEVIETLLLSSSISSLRIERIVSNGQSTPLGEWLEEQTNEWVVLLKGSAGLVFADNDNELALNEGDSILIKARQKHRVTWTSKDEPTVWLAIHYHGK